MAKQPDKDSETTAQVVWAGDDMQARAMSVRATTAASAAAPAAPAPRQAGEQAAPPPQRPAPSPREAGTTPAAPAQRPSTPAEQAKVLAETVVTSFVSRLKSEARKKGGYLTADNIDQLGSELEKKTAALEQVFRQSFETYVKARERAAFDHARQFPFDRLIVNSFAELFSPGHAKKDGADAVTRAVLPGFFMAIDMMLGEDTLEAYQKACRAIVERLSPGQDSELDWEIVYADPEASLLTIMALIEIAPYFEDYAKRRDWFINLVNDNLAAGSDWQLTETGFANLTDALFEELGVALDHAEIRDKLINRMSGTQVYGAERALRAIAKAHGRD